MGMGMSKGDDKQLASNGLSCRGIIRRAEANGVVTGG